MNEVPYPPGPAAAGESNTRAVKADTSSLEFSERTAAPPVAGVDKATVWLQDNGSGKSQLMIQFATGAPIAIATQV